MPQSARAPRRLLRLELEGWRNLAPLDLAPGPGVNVLHGDNGAGKSNFLEAVHYVSALRSFRGAKTVDLVAGGAPRARLRSRWSDRPLERHLEVRLDREAGRRIALDGKRPRSISAWHTAVPVVLFHAGDLGLPSGAPEPRRAYLDRILEELDPIYGSALASYQKALRSRNRLLRGERIERGAVAAFDELLATAGEVVGKTRRALVADLGPRTERAFDDVSGGQFPLVARYAPRLEPDADVIREALARSFDKDRARGFTTAGPHGDDLVLAVGGGPGVRHHASQGQHRAIALALKIAELEVLSERTGWVPPLLLDDVSSELDRTRNRRLFDRLRALGAQVFLTTTHPQFILVERDRCDFRVDAGRVVAEPPPGG